MYHLIGSKQGSRNSSASLISSCGSVEKADNMIPERLIGINYFF